MRLVCSDYKWLNKLNFVNSKILLPIIFVLILLYNTAVNIWMKGRIETLQNVIAIAILLIIAINFVLYPRKILGSWIKENYLVVAYFIIRGISWINSGFDYSVLRTIFFEAFFVIGIAICMIDKRTNYKLYQQIFIIVEFLFSLLCVIAFFIGKTNIFNVQNWLNEYTYYGKFEMTAFFGNPNTGGIMAGFAIIISIILYKECKQKWLILYAIYNIMFLFFEGSRNAILSTFLILILKLIIDCFKYRNKKRIIAFCLTGCLAIMAGIYAFTCYNIDIAPKHMSNVEYKISRISSDRYIIWKECIIEQKDHPLFGAGNLNLEQQNRTELFNDSSYSYLYPKATEFGPHNGYIGMVSGTGWLGFALFIMILFQRIRRAEILKEGNWYLALIFILVINLFESLFILNRFFTCFYMFMILEMKGDREDTDNNDKYNILTEDKI